MDEKSPQEGKPSPPQDDISIGMGIWYFACAIAVVGVVVFCVILGMQCAEGMR